MSMVFQSELAKLQSRGVGLGDLLPDEVEALVHACDRVARPFSDVNADAAGMPIRVCDGVYFWRPTIGACLWLDEYARKWWNDRPIRLKWAFVYALLHARERDAFAELTNEDAAEKAIKADALRLCVNEKEVDAALDRMFPADPSTEDRDERGERPESQPDWASVLARLESQTGMPSMLWAWEHSSDYALRCYVDLAHFATAASGAKAQRMRDELDRAVSALARLKAAIVERVKARRGATDV